MKLPTPSRKDVVVAVVVASGVPASGVLDVAVDVVRSDAVDEASINKTADTSEVVDVSEVEETAAATPEASAGADEVESDDDEVWSPKTGGEASVVDEAVELLMTAFQAWLSASTEMAAGGAFATIFQAKLRMTLVGDSD